MPTITGFTNDDFEDGTIAAFWNEQDAKGDSSWSEASGKLTASVPGGTSHDQFNSARDSLKLYQEVTDGDFDVWFEFEDPSSTGNFQMIGLFFGDTADATDWLRVDWLFNSGERLYVGRTIANSTATLFNSPLTFNGIRVTRTVNDWEIFTGSPGSWTSRHTFTWANTITMLGIHAGNASGATSPANNASALYIEEVNSTSGGGGTTVTLPDPVLSEATGFTLSISYAPLTVTLPDPVLSESVGFALSVSYADLTVTLPDPTLSESLGFPLSVSYDPLVVTLPAPSLAEGVGYPLSISSGAISITLPDPVLSEATGFDLSVSYAPLTVTLTDPVLSEGVGFTIQVSYAQLNIVLPNPILSETIGFDLSVSYGSLAGLTTYMPMSQDPSVVMGMEIGRPFLA